MPSLRHRLGRLRLWTRHRRGTHRSASPTQPHQFQPATLPASEDSTIRQIEPAIATQDQVATEQAATEQDHSIDEHDLTAAVTDEETSSVSEVTEDQARNPIFTQLHQIEEQRQVLLRDVTEALREVRAQNARLSNTTVRRADLTNVRQEYEESQRRYAELRARYDELLNGHDERLEARNTLPELRRWPRAPRVSSEHGLEPKPQSQDELEPEPESVEEPDEHPPVVQLDELAPGEGTHIHADLPANLGRGASAAILLMIAREMSGGYWGRTTNVPPSPP